MISVDCTDVPIQEPMVRSSKWFSHKFSGSGLRYEIGISLQLGNIVWIHGPYPCGSWPDIKIFRDCLRTYLDENERVEADDGYCGDAPRYCKTPTDFCSIAEDVDKYRNRLRARHETVNKRLKDFDILVQTYRHDVENHSHVFRAVAVLVQLGLLNGEPLFQLE